MQASAAAQIDCIIRRLDWKSLPKKDRLLSLHGMRAIVPSPAWLLAAVLSATIPFSSRTNAEEAVAKPLTGPDDIIALAQKHRERWQNPKGTWDFLPDSLTGSGDCRISL